MNVHVLREKKYIIFFISLAVGHHGQRARRIFLKIGRTRIGQIKQKHLFLYQIITNNVDHKSLNVKHEISNKGKH